MKRSLLACCLLFAVLNTQAQKKIAEKVIAIAFESFGRRGRDEVNIKADSATCTNRKGTKGIALTAATWKRLQKSTAGLKLKSLKLLKAPTSARDVDGALHCKLTIVTNKGSYESQFFDCGKPMKQLHDLYNQVEAIRSEINSHVPGTEQ